MDYLELIVSITGDIAKGREITIAQLAESGYESFEETDTGVKAYKPSGNFDPGSLDNLIILNSSEFNNSAYTYSVIKTENWNRKWEESYDPISVGSYCHIRAMFHPSSTAYRHEIVIQPKMSFGTGHHDTTWLMIDSMEKTDFSNKLVLDLGCGTGILSILAAKSGAKKVYAVDIDEWAVKNTIENCKINGVQNVEVSHGDINVVGKSTKYDVILANITRNIIIEYAAAFSLILAAKGKLLLSGFYTDDFKIIESEAMLHGLKEEWTNSKNRWAMAVFTTK